MNSLERTQEYAEPEHPSAEQLNAFVLGQLDDDSSAQVERHVADCPVCGKLLETSPDDSFVVMFQEAYSSTTLDGAAAPVSPSRPTRFVRGYQLLEVLGEGGMGVIWKARQEGLDRFVALKRIRSTGQPPAEALARFRREAEAVARLQHSKHRADLRCRRAGRRTLFGFGIRRGRQSRSETRRRAASAVPGLRADRNAGPRHALCPRTGHHSPRFELDRAIAIMDKLCCEDPQNSSLRELLLGCLVARMCNNTLLHCCDEGDKDWQRAVALSTQLNSWRDLCIGVWCDSRLGDHALAAARAEKLVKQPRLNGEDLYQLAKAFALAAAAVHRDNQLTPSEQERRSDRYAAEAVALLSKLRGNGYFKDVEHLKQLRADPELDSLRKRDDFVRLVNDVTRPVTLK